MTVGRVAIQTVSISFFRFSSGLDRLWAFAQMGAARISLARTPDIGFWKLLGSGTGEGFTPVPNTAVYAILATWPSLDIARDRIANARPFDRYHAKASEVWTVFLAATSVRGRWARTSPFETGAEIRNGPIAALTRATIKPRILLKFWQRVPKISDVIGKDATVIFKIGVGELPLLHQVTFSIWPDTTTMANFARNDGPHAKAIAAVRAEDWFSEELYARFAVLGSQGSWNGQDPLAQQSQSKVVA